MATKTTTVDPTLSAPTLAPEPALPEEQPSRWPPMLRALRHRNYRLFFAGQLISLSGTWMQNVAQGWLVLRLTDSPALLGLTAAASSLPVLLFSLPAGTLADRLPKRQILLISQIVALALAAILAFLTLSGLVEVWHVLLLALALGMVNAFDAPARQAFTVEMVGRDDLLNAIALNSSVFNGARIIGPAIAGMLVAAIGEGPAFLLNAISFTAVIIGLLQMRMVQPQRPPRARGGGELREGLAYIIGEPRVRVLLLQVGAIGFFAFVHIPLLPYFARDVLGSGASGLGWLSASSGLGALIASLMLAKLGSAVRRGRLLHLATLSYAPIMIAFAFSPWLPLSMLLLALAGWAGVTSIALSNTLIQSIVPDHLRGRVMSVFTLSMMGLSPLGGMLAGMVAEAWGSVPLAVFSFDLVALLIVVIVAIRAPFLRDL